MEQPRWSVLERPWPLGGLMLVVGLLGFLYYPTLLNLGREWYGDNNYSHGFLIPFVSAYLAWQRREQLGALNPKPSRAGLSIIALGLLLLASSAMASELFLRRVSFLIVLTGLVWWVLGTRGLRILALPLAMLLFMVPPPPIVFNAIAAPLQGFAAQVAEGALALMGIPVLREGNIIVLANTRLEVAEACSGIRSLITLMALSAIFTSVTGMCLWRALVMVLAAVPIAVVANAARVTATGLLAHAYGASVAEGFFHVASGWLLFLVAAVLLALLAVGLRLHAPTHDAKAPLPVEPLALSANALAGLTRRLWLASGLLAVTLAGLAAVSSSEAVPLRRSFDAFPSQVGTWQGVREALPPSILEALRLSDYLNRLYVKPAHVPIWLYVAYFDARREDQLIHSPQNCLPGSGWSITSQRQLTVTLPGRAGPVVINQMLISKDGERQLVLYWYEERGRIVANEYAASWYMLVDGVGTRRTNGALVRVSAPVIDSEAATLAQMLDFVDAAYPELARSLPE